MCVGAKVLFYLKVCYLWLKTFAQHSKALKENGFPQNPQTWFWPTALIHGSVSVSLMSCGRLTGYCENERAGGYAERLGQSVFAASVSWLKVKIAHSLVSCAAFFLAEWMEDAIDLVDLSARVTWSICQQTLRINNQIWLMNYERSGQHHCSFDFFISFTSFWIIIFVSVSCSYQFSFYCSKTFSLCE